MKKKLILNADDYGATDFIDRGIIRGVEEGVVNSVSALVCFPDSAERIKEKLLPLSENRGVKIGLHLCITAGYSFNKYSSLINSDENDFVWLKNLKVNYINKEELKAEIRDQIERLGEILGGVQHIEHINHHHGIFYFDRFLFNALMEVLQAYKQDQVIFRMRSPLPWSKSGLIYYDYSPFYPWTKIRWTAIQSAKNRLFRRAVSIWRFFKGTFLNSIAEVNDHLINYNAAISYCYVDQYYGQANAHNLKKIIENMPDDGKVVEFMLHLGDGSYKNDKPWGIDLDYFPDRQKELDVMIDNKQILNLVKLINYEDVT